MPRWPGLTLEERFWSKVDRRGPDECWPWKGAFNYAGYGFFAMCGTLGFPRTGLAHRVAWRLTQGPIPPDVNVLHHCDNPPCCNPADLFLGSQEDNVLDMESKGRGRHPAGEECGLAKLSAAQVSEIRGRYATGGVRQIDLAREFGIGQTTVSDIVRGEAWREVARV